MIGLEGLGWSVGSWKAGYRANLPKLSLEEERLVLAVAERVRERAEKASQKDSGFSENEEVIRTALEQECEIEGIELDEDQKEYIVRASFLHTFGMGFLEPFLSDSSLEEIAVIGVGKPIYVYVRKEGWKKSNVCITSQDCFVSLVNRLGRGLGRRLTAQQPRLNAVLEDGSRLHASMPPVSQCEMTIRKFSESPFSPFDLVSFQTYTPHMLALLSMGMQSDMTIMVAGNTASGKTSTLNALLAFVPCNERVLIIEETPEIRISHAHQIRLFPFEEGNIDMAELVRDSLRMRPDRVVVGEVRSPAEVRAFVESTLSGQAKGCYATFHAKSSREALTRMMASGCIKEDLEGIELFVIQRRVSEYSRKGRGIREVRKVTEVALSNGDDPMKPAVIYDGKKFSKKGVEMLMRRISEGSGMSVGEVRAEVLARAKMFSEKSKAGADFESAFAQIQKRFYGIEVSRT